MKGMSMSRGLTMQTPVSSLSVSPFSTLWHLPLGMHCHLPLPGARTQ